LTRKRKATSGWATFDPSRFERSDVVVSAKANPTWELRCKAS
jgi:hypothetical protein